MSCRVRKGVGMGPTWIETPQELDIRFFSLSLSVTKWKMGGNWWGSAFIEKKKSID